MSNNTCPQCGSPVEPQVIVTNTPDLTIYVKKEQGQSLYPDTDRDKLAAIEPQANKYIHPEDENTRHVSDQEKDTWNAKADQTSVVDRLAGKADLLEGKVRTDQLPALAITDTFAVNSEQSMLYLEALQKYIKPKEISQPWNIKYIEKEFNNSKQFIDYLNANKIDSKNVEIFDEKSNKWITIMDLGLDKNNPFKKVTKNYQNYAIINDVTDIILKAYKNEISITRAVTESLYKISTKRSVFAIFDLIMNDGVKGFAKLFGDGIPEDWNFFNELYNGMAKAWKEDMNKNGWLRFKSRIKEIVTNPY